MSPDQTQRLQVALESWGACSHFYLDANSQVRIGFGHVIPDLASAYQLRMSYAFSRQPAAPIEIAADWCRVIATTNPGGKYSPDYYARCCWCALSHDELQRLLDVDIAAAERDLVDRWPAFSLWPAGAQLALMDLRLDLGMTALLGRAYLALTLLARDFRSALQECRKQGLTSGARGAQRQAWLEQTLHGA